eukprot:scaffold6174_cov125-Isochrysis_galbana.AAC.17
MGRVGRAGGHAPTRKTDGMKGRPSRFVHPRWPDPAFRHPAPRHLPPPPTTPPPVTSPLSPHLHRPSLVLPFLPTILRCSAPRRTPAGSSFGASSA